MSNYPSVFAIVFLGSLAAQVVWTGSKYAFRCMAEKTNDQVTCDSGIWDENEIIETRLYALRLMQAALLTYHQVEFSKKASPACLELGSCNLSSIGCQSDISIPSRSSHRGSKSYQTSFGQ